jgi:hypothetical protein
MARAGFSYYAIGRGKAIDRGKPPKSEPKSEQKSE